MAENPGGPGLFITSSGTGTGKTLVACALCHQLRAKGRKVRALKPVISGFRAAEAETSDTGLLLESLGLAVSSGNIERISPWRFEAAIAPNMAARREGGEIDLAALTDFCRAALERDNVTLIEGVGGVSAPLSDTATVMDWMAALKLPTLVVLGSYLGAISHGLTAIEATAGRNVPIAGIIVNESPESPVDLAETVDTFQRFLPDYTILPVARVAPDPRPWEKLPDFTALVESRLQ